MVPCHMGRMEIQTVVPSSQPTRGTLRCDSMLIADGNHSHAIKKRKQLPEVRFTHLIFTSSSNHLKHSLIFTIHYNLLRLACAELEVRHLIYIHQFYHLMSSIATTAPRRVDENTKPNSRPKIPMPSSSTTRAHQEYAKASISNHQLSTFEVSPSRLKSLTPLPPDFSIGDCSPLPAPSPSDLGLGLPGPSDNDETARPASNLSGIPKNTSNRSSTASYHPSIAEVGSSIPSARSASTSPSTTETMPLSTEWDIPDHLPFQLSDLPNPMPKGPGPWPYLSEAAQVFLYGFYYREAANATLQKTLGANTAADRISHGQVYAPFDSTMPGRSRCVSMTSTKIGVEELLERRATRCYFPQRIEELGEEDRKARAKAKGKQKAYSDPSQTTKLWESTLPSRSAFDLSMGSDGDLTPEVDPINGQPTWHIGDVQSLSQHAVPHGLSYHAGDVQSPKEIPVSPSRPVSAWESSHSAGLSARNVKPEQQPTFDAFAVDLDEAEKGGLDSKLSKP